MNITKLATVGILALVMASPSPAKAGGENFSGPGGLAMLALVGSVAGYAIANSPHSGRFLGDAAGNMVGGLVQGQFIAPQHNYIIVPQPHYVPPYYVAVPHARHHRRGFNTNSLVPFLGLADK